MCMPTDADVETLEMQNAAAMLTAAKRAGRCGHPWTQTYTVAFRPDLKPGQAECLECGKIADEAELEADYQAVC